MGDRLPRLESINMNSTSLSYDEEFFCVRRLRIPKTQGGGQEVANIQTKQEVVNEIKAKLENATAVVLVDYRGLTVEEDTQLRKVLRESNVEYKVYKNTLFNIAVKGTQFESISDILSGPTAIAFSTEDATAPARELQKFAETHKNLEFKGGVVDGNFYDAKTIEQIATIPSKEVLLSKLLGSIQSPITNLARVIKQIAEKDGSATEAAAE